MKQDNKFKKGLEELINSYSMENGSDTPDFILATYLLGCLRVFDKAIIDREIWYDRPTKHLVEDEWTNQLPTEEEWESEKI
jgi:anti-sigma-K factor RskA